MSERLVVMVGPGHPGDGAFKLRVSPEYAREVTGELRAGGFECDQVQEFSEGTELMVFLVAFTQAGGLDGLANILAAVFSRHDGKRFVVRGPNNVELEAEGYAAREVLKLLEAAANHVADEDANWNRIKDGGNDRAHPELGTTDPDFD